MYKDTLSMGDNLRPTPVTCTNDIWHALSVSDRAHNTVLLMGTIDAIINHKCCFDLKMKLGSRDKFGYAVTGPAKELLFKH